MGCAYVHHSHHNLAQDDNPFQAHAFTRKFVSLKPVDSCSSRYLFSSHADLQDKNFLKDQAAVKALSMNSMGFIRNLVIASLAINTRYLEILASRIMVE